MLRFDQPGLEQLLRELVPEYTRNEAADVPAISRRAH